MSEPLVALSGATGFLGGHVLEALAQRGFRLRILVRHAIDLPPHLREITEIIAGDLTSGEVLDRLLSGASTVIHLAGLTKALSKRDFMAVNRDGTERIAKAANRLANDAHFILISSLAAREPHLSAYAASKRAAEEVARAVYAQGRLTILRPSAIYGPGDRELLPVFKLARMPFIPLFGQTSSRIALAHVTDVAAAIVTLAAKPAYSQTETNLYSFGGAIPQGHNWQEILVTAASAQGRKSRFIQLPPAVAATTLGTAGGISEALAYLTGKPRVFTLDKAREMLHPDWSVPENELLPQHFDTPSTPLQHGFEATVAWYRAVGLLP